MTLPLIILWIVAIALCALGGAYYARRSDAYDALLGLFVTLVIASNLFASKIIGFDLGFATLFAPGATLLFSATFLLSDMVNERFGRPLAQRMILIGFAAQVAFVLFSYIVLRATPAPFFTGQAAFDAVFASVPRVVAAGLATYLVSESLDAYVYAAMRRAMQGRHLWARYVVGTLPAMLIDSALFVTLAFAGVQPLLPLAMGLTAVKWLVGIIDMPFMYAARSIMRESVSGSHHLHDGV